MASIFTKIINGEIPAHKVYESDAVVAFMDINPVNPGHVLVVPRKEVDDLFQLDEETYMEVMKVSKKLAAAIQKAFNPLRVGALVLGFDVPHAHVHLIPLQGWGDIRTRRMLEPDMPKRSDGELKGDAERIRGVL